MNYKVGDKVRILKSRSSETVDGVRNMIGISSEVKDIDNLHEQKYQVWDKDKKVAWWFSEDELELVADQPANLISLIAKELGVEIGEEFEICTGYNAQRFKFENNGLKKYLPALNAWGGEDIALSLLLNGYYKIKKLPPKPKLTEVERVILENLPKECKYITRENENANNDLLIHRTKPKKLTVVWSDYSLEYYLDAFNHLFQFIKWEDEEPYNIQELLEEYAIAKERIENERNE